MTRCGAHGCHRATTAKTCAGLAVHTVEETLELCPSPYEDGPDDRLRAALAAYRGPQG